MSEIIEKRTVNIPPCKIDKTLIREIGDLLEKEKLCKDRMSYSLDTKTKDVQSSKVSDFINADWGSDINEITIKTDYKSPRVNVRIKFHNPSSSAFSVSGKDATWVNGITNRIENKFKKYKLNYYTIKTNWLIKLPLTFIITLVLSSPIFLGLNAIITPDQKSTLQILMVLLVSYLYVAIYYLIQWLFPYFDYGEPLQRRMRKWIWALLFGSGLVPTIILKYLGY